MNAQPHVIPPQSIGTPLESVWSAASRSRSELLPRERLLGPILDRPVARGYVLVAPAGFGKTTLLKQWVDYLGTDAAWVVMPGQSAEPHGFLERLGTAIDFGDHTLAPTFRRLISAGVTDPRRTSEALLDDLGRNNRPIAIVIDDFHLCEAEAVHEFVQRLLDQLPGHLCLMIASRTEPALRLARHRVLGTVVSLSVEDLRFSDNEAFEFLDRRFGDVVARSIREIIVASVDGWAAGLQMAALAIGGRSVDDATMVLDRFSGRDDLVSDFLMEEVFNQLSPDVREFLLKTSICDRFTADLSVALTEATDAGDTLDQIWRGGLFLSMAQDRGSGVWFRYHHLFREFLRRTLVRTYPLDVVASIHLRASDWFASHAKIDDAIHHALAAGAWERVVTLAKPLLVQMFLADRAVEVRDWLERLPRDLVERDPDISFMLAYALARMGSPVAATRTIEVAEAGWAAAGIAEGTAIGALARGAIARGREDGADLIRQAERNFAAMRAVADGVDTDVAPVHSPVRLQMYQRPALTGASNVASALHYATGLRMLGKPADAIVVIDDIIRFCNEHGRGTMGNTARVERCAAMIQLGQLRPAADLANLILSQGDVTSPNEQRHALFWLADIYREWNQLDAAEQALIRVETISQRIQFRTLLPRTHIYRARIAWARDRYDDAMAHLDAAIDSAHAVEARLAARDAHAIRARINLARGDHECVSAWLLDTGVSAHDEPDFRRLTQHLTLARILIARDEPRQAIRLLDRHLSLATAEGRHSHRIKLLVVKALAHQDLSELDAAVAELSLALELGQPGGYTRIFLDEGVPMRHLLRTALARDVAPTAVIALLRQLTVEGQQSESSRQPLVEPLTQREIDVLRLIAVGLANREIADSLYISVSTVKRHITNLYGKLGVTTRTEAVERSYQLGIL